MYSLYKCEVCDTVKCWAYTSHVKVEYCKVCNILQIHNRLLLNKSGSVTVMEDEENDEPRKD